MERWSSIELTPFLALAMSQFAVIHLSMSMGESSQIVPDLGRELLSTGFVLPDAAAWGVVVFFRFAVGAERVVKQTERRKFFGNDV